MTLDNLLTPNSVSFIKEVGFPIASFIIMVSILMFVMKRDVTRQEKTEARYESLVNKFIDSTKVLSEKNEAVLKDITFELRDITSELRVITTKVDTYASIIDEELQARSQTYIFDNKESKDDKRKKFPR